MTRTLAGAACALLVTLSGCAKFAEQPEVNPDRYAPLAVDRVWTPAPINTESYTIATRDQVESITPEQGQAMRAYDLPALIDVALSHNPSTRRAWQSARLAAARYGIARSPYYPKVSFDSDQGYVRFPFQDAGRVSVVKQWEISPIINATYTLLDFGRRSSSAKAARERLAAANYTFNRTMQDIVFNVERSFYALGASKAAVAAAEQNLKLAKTDLDAVQQRLDLGLATEPALLLARQRVASGEFDLASANVLVSDAQANLAVAMGIAANVPLQVESLEAQPLPNSLGAEVDQLINDAIKLRPDLASRVATLKSREASVRRAKAEFYPTLGVTANYGENLWQYTFSGPPAITTGTPQYEALLTLKWDLFTGFSHLNGVREAEAEREEARADLQSLELNAISAVWRAYHDFKAAQKKYQFAEALLAASRDAYQSTLETYRQGLSTIVELLTADRDVANARYTMIQSRADLLTSYAAVTYAAGAIPIPGHP
ncbi:MAG TPA: TolC family protein [Candidatus Binataceae bacterium]